MRVDVDTEHILLALVRENEGVAVRVLLDYGADAAKVRSEIIGVLNGTNSRAEVLASIKALEKAGYVTAFEAKRIRKGIERAS